MKCLVTMLLLLSASVLIAGEDDKKITVGGKSHSINSNFNFADLAHQMNVEKDLVKRVEQTSLTLTLNDNFSDTPFLYFFNGLIPKDSQDPRVWFIDGHYLNIVKTNNVIAVNNLYLCNSLRLSPSKDHLICVSEKSSRRINFDGTTRDSKSTGDVCPPEERKSFTYGNCVMTAIQEGVRCRIEIAWPDTFGSNKIKKSCRKIEIQGELLHCRRKKLKNNETLELGAYCLTDSSIMNSPEIFDRNRLDYFKTISPALLEAKEPPPSEGKAK